MQKNWDHKFKKIMAYFYCRLCAQFTSRWVLCSSRVLKFVLHDLLLKLLDFGFLMVFLKIKTKNIHFIRNIFKLISVELFCVLSFFSILIAQFIWKIGFLFSIYIYIIAYERNMRMHTVLKWNLKRILLIISTKCLEFLYHYEYHI